MTSEDRRSPTVSAVQQAAALAGYELSVSDADALIAGLRAILAADRRIAALRLQTPPGLPVPFPEQAGKQTGEQTEEQADGE